MKPIPEYVLTSHAATELRRHGLDERLIRSVLETPGQTHAVRKGRIVVQGIRSVDDPARTYLVRVFVVIDRDPPEVVTAHRTSKVQKYWKEEM